MKTLYKSLVALVATALIFSSCKEEEATPDTGSNVPSTYSFDDVSYSGQITRKDMLAELTSYIKSSHDGNAILDSTKINNMYTGSGFDIPALDTSGKNLSGKNLDLVTTKYFDPIPYLNDAVTASTTASTSSAATKGNTGLLERGTSGQYVLVDANGFEYAQVIDKGLMSTVFMDQALNNYLNEIELDDNTDATYEAGKGTDMAHHWDEAYGYLTDDLDFPSNNEDDKRFWDNYSNGRDGLIGSNSVLGVAFRTGRQAIVDNDVTTVTAQATIIKAEWTKVAAATTIHYLIDGKEYFSGDNGNKFHALSEAYGFLLGVKVGGGSVDTIISDFETKGLYDLTEDDLNSYIDQLASAYGLESVKTAL